MEMEDTLTAIFGSLFGLAIFVKAFYDAGKLPGGPVPGNPAPSKPFPARTDILEKEPESLNGTELDAEEEETIRRVVEIRDRVEARKTALSRMGLEITNLDKW